MKRNKFSLSHYRLMSLKMGGLYPCGLVEVLPGDTFQHASTMLLRMQPLLHPVMHPVHARIHHWYVPHRLVWSDWESFITGGSDGMDASVFPTINIDIGSTSTGGGGIGTLGDYLGLPSENAGSFAITTSALPFRGYALIFNEWYRDQDLVSPIGFSKASGADSTTNKDLQSVAWEKDYFTSARPWTQKGPTVTIPLAGGPAPVYGIGVEDGAVATNTADLTRMTTAGHDVASPSPMWTPANTLRLQAQSAAAASGTNRPQVFADLANITAADINDLRLAFALQRYEEARARYGSRYTEYLRYLGVKSSDARLQRPEYLGGGKQTIQFSEVLQTGGASTGDPTGLGNLGGHGIAGVRSNRYRRFFEEHGYVYSFLSIKPRTVYAQGLARTLNRRVKEDFWQRELQHIGQQEVLNKELYSLGATPEGTFGFQDRYDEYRRMESSVNGEFRTTLLQDWHMARIFAAQPVLNSSFVQSNPTNRIFADQTGNDTMLAMISHSIQARRMVAKTGTSFIL